MSILVDNAFDATEDGGHIEIVIDSDGTKTSIETLNARPTHTATMRRDFFTKGYSTKPQREGR